MFVHVDCWCQLDASFFHLYFPVTFTSPSPKCPAYCAPLTPPNRFWWKEKAQNVVRGQNTRIWSGTKWGLTGHSAPTRCWLSQLTFILPPWPELWRWWAVCLRFCRALEEKSASKIGGANEFTIKKSSSVASERRYHLANCENCRFMRLKTQPKRLIMIGVWLVLHLEGWTGKFSITVWSA